jgi:hypothetical protein
MLCLSLRKFGETWCTADKRGLGFSQVWHLLHRRFNYYRECTIWNVCWRKREMDTQWADRDSDTHHISLEISYRCSSRHFYVNLFVEQVGLNFWIISYICWYILIGHTELPILIHQCGSPFFHLLQSICSYLFVSLTITFLMNRISKVLKSSMLLIQLLCFLSNSQQLPITWQLKGHENWSPIIIWLSFYKMKFPYQSTDCPTPSINKHQ